MVGVSTTKPPVGKSGPLIIFKKSLGFASLFAIANLTASVTSRKLYGGMLVAIATAIPSAPLTKRFGNLAGRTFGSEVSPE